MNILVTGASGFIGRNLVEALQKRQAVKILEYDKNSDPSTLADHAANCDFVCHLAAVHRPADRSEFMKVNHLLFAQLLGLLRANNNKCPVLLPSSIQAGDKTDYGNSKVAAENELKNHAALINARAIIYRLTNTFGRYAEPNHHSVVATFCFNIIRGLPVEISDPQKVVRFYYIDDVIASFTAHLDRELEPDPDGIYRLPEEMISVVTLEELFSKIISFKKSIERGLEPGLPDLFTARLYETFLSYR